jgi:hypothetical protein
MLAVAVLVSVALNGLVTVAVTVLAPVARRMCVVVAVAVVPSPCGHAA